jgi:cyclic beta-1,2-glucan synthetase
MAHHQGMSLLAICNTSHRNAFLRWFHAEPSIAAVELLLHERVPRSMKVEPAEEPVAA